MRERGFQPEQICAVTSINHDVVSRIIEEDDDNNILIKEHWEQKIPVMRDIVAMGLSGIKETLKEMIDPEVRAKMIRNINDLSALTNIVDKLNILLRLEEGKSTANVETKHTTYQETRHVLQELGKIDPVFDYPVEALPAPEPSGK